MNPFNLFLPFLLLSALSAGAAAATFTTAPDSTSRYPVYAVAGAIGKETVLELKKALASNNPGRGRVVFDSDGGDLLAGLELGSLIRKEGLDTEIAKYNGQAKTGAASCHSACVLALLGGNYRFASPDSLIGLHRFHRKNAEQGDLALAQVVSNAIGAHILSMGASYSLFGRMIEVAGNQLSFLPFRDAKSLGLINQGRFETEWKVSYQVRGAAVLTASRRQFRSEGDISLTCSPRRPALLSISFRDASPHQGALRTARTLELSLGPHVISLSDPANAPRLNQDSVVHDFYLAPGDTWGLRSAHSIAVRFNGETVFDVEKGPDAALVDAFLLLCEGSSHHG